MLDIWYNQADYPLLCRCNGCNDGIPTNPSSSSSIKPVELFSSPLPLLGGKGGPSYLAGACLSLPLLCRKGITAPGTLSESPLTRRRGGGGKS